MTDPKNWKGEWRNTKHFDRLDHTDIQEVHCLPNLNAAHPRHRRGRGQELDKRAAEEKAAAAAK